MIDVIYPAFNRLEFTRITWRLLMENTDWDLVRSVRIYEDGSTDGTREFLDAAKNDCPVECSLTYLGFRSPVASMRHYTNDEDAATLFAKVDNDIAVPPGWLDVLAATMLSTDVELLGFQYGFGDDPPGGPAAAVEYDALPAEHIGGVGLMKTSAFRNAREPLMPAGRFGFTRWQYRNDPRRAWLTPGLLAPQLDLIPDEPYAGWSARYVAAGWQRYWPPYDESSRRAWDWIGP